MTVRHPTTDVIWQTDIAVVATRRGGQIDQLPIAVVGVGIRPTRVVPRMESPRTVQQCRRCAQFPRIRTATDRQIGNHQAQNDKSRREYDGDQPALRCL